MNTDPPNANAVMHEHLYSIGPAVGKQAGVVAVRHAENVYAPSQCSVGSGTHIHI